MNKLDAIELAKNNYKDYAIYVNSTRALANIYDGLKDVQRRIIYAANAPEFNRITKSAELEGAVMKYHPHGSSYGAIVNLACPTNNLPLFDIQGNFGGFNTGASASRYTACRLSDIARFIYCQFMDYAPMIVGEIGKMEPAHLPCLLPYSLIEGSNGIGIGLASDGVPLNIIDLINYYIDYIQNEEFNSDLLPKPEFGASILMQEDSEWKVEMLKYDGSFYMHPIITQESDNIFVIKSLYGTNIDALLKKLRWYINSDKVDFRDETKLSERYVFEIIDKSVAPEDFKRDLTKFTTKKIHHNRVFTKDGVSIYCGLNYVITNQLRVLNEAIDRKLSTEKDKILKKSRLLRVLAFYKTTPVFNNLSSKSKEELISDMLKYPNEESDYDLCKEIISKPISYLTKDHDNELNELNDQLKEINNHNRKEYLISLYNKLKDMLSELYNSRSHTVLMNQLITDPRAYLDNNSLIIRGKGRGTKFKNNVYLITQDSCVIKKSLSSDSESTIDNINEMLWEPSDKFIAVCSDLDDYIELICNDDTRLVFDVKSYKYDKKIINLRDDQKVVKCNGYTEKTFPEDMRYLIKSKISRSMK